MLGMEAKIHKYQTYRFNLGTTRSFNADFDGDEMNAHIPQSQDALAEVKYLMRASNNIISAKESKPIVVIVQDALIALYLMSRYNEPIKKHTFYDIALQGSRPDDTSLINVNKLKTIKSVLEKFGKENNIYNSRGLISLLLPDDLFYEKKNSVHPEEPIVKIYQGVLVEGALDKSILGNAYNSLIQIFNKEYGEKTASNFIDNAQFIGNAWIVWHGFSIGLADCMPASKNSRKEISKILTQCYVKAQGIEETTQNPGIREVRVTGALSQAKEVGMTIAKNAMRHDNNFLTTIYSGAKGDFFNIAQITGLLGQQNLEGQRVEPKLNHGKRSLPHYPMKMTKEQEYESKGFVSNSFIRGLNAREFFFHAMSGREGVGDTAMSTQKSGYIERKLVKSSEDLQQQYDGTIRDTTGKVFQFSYGGNGLDPMRTVQVNNKPQICDIKRIVTRINSCHELGIPIRQEENNDPELEVEVIKKKKKSSSMRELSSRLENLTLEEKDEKEIIEEENIEESKKEEEKESEESDSESEDDSEEEDSEDESGEDESEEDEEEEEEIDEYYEEDVDVGNLEEELMDD